MAEARSLSRLATVALVVAIAGVSLIADPGRRPLAFYGLLAVAFLALGLAAWARERIGIGPATVLILAALLRVVLLPAPPSLSDDVYRYLWDGRVLLAGHNPYATRPDADELADLRDERWHLVAHRDVETVYPPLAMLLFTAAAALPHPLLAYRLLLIAVDLAACGLLVVLCRRLELPPARVLWYAWNPLVALEVAGMGHVDALGVAAVIGAVLCLCRARTRAELSAGAAAAGVLAKLLPIVCLPLWARHTRQPARFVTIVLLLLAVSLAPIVWSTSGAPPGLVRYGLSWEFNGPLYEPLWRGLGALQADTAVKAGLDRLKDLTGWHDFWNLVYPYVYPRLLAKAVLALVLLLVVMRSWWERDVLAGTRLLLGAALLLQATFYPWYLLWVLPFAALNRAWPWLLLSATMPLAYLPRLTGVALFPLVYLGVWLPPLALWIWRSWRR